MSIVFKNKHKKENTKFQLFLQESYDDKEETYIENYGNPIWSVSKQYFMVVVEKEEHKVSIKLFYGYKFFDHCDWMNFSRKHFSNL